MYIVVFVECGHMLRVFQVLVLVFFFFKQKTAYEMRISDWSSDVCSSDLWRENARAQSGVGSMSKCSTSSRVPIFVYRAMAGSSPRAACTSITSAPRFAATCRRSPLFALALPCRRCARATSRSELQYPLIRRSDQTGQVRRGRQEVR